MKINYLIPFIKTTITRLFYSTLLFRFGFGSRVSKGIWEKQYNDNEWDFLFSEDEKEHYRAIITQIKHYNTKPALLDIGCGHGVLYNYFNKALTSDFDYVGIDISENAIKKATEKFSGVDFKAIDYDYEMLTGQFNIIIFNEVLYYFVKPLKILHKAIKENLCAGGVLIVSMYNDDKGKNELIWKNIDEHFKVLTKEVVQNDKGVAWTIKTITPN
jgi:2-polyprenyl-3-methyl-5-hydroxy-6-metoxy-1,4-benzoquinol methylase